MNPMAESRQPAWKNPGPLNPLPDPSARAWDRWYRETDVDWPQVNPRVRKTLDGLTPGRALDLGCGDGRHSVWLATRNWRVDALDISAEALRIGQERAFAEGVSDLVSWTCADATQFTPEPGTLSLVLASFLDLPDQSMAEVVSRSAPGLAPGGRFLLIGHDAKTRPPSASEPRDSESMHSAMKASGSLRQAGMSIESFGTYPRAVPGSRWPVFDHIVLARASNEN